jgi:hypothetical protein
VRASETPAIQYDLSYLHDSSAEPAPGWNTFDDSTMGEIIQGALVRRNGRNLDG